MKITVKQLRTIIKEEVSKAHLDSKIEDWVEQHREELEKFFASNPKAAKIVTKAASLGEGRIREDNASKFNAEKFAAGVKDYYTSPNAAHHDVAGAATGLIFGGAGTGLGLLAMMPGSLADSLVNAIGGAPSAIVAGTVAAILAGHLGDVVSHAQTYAGRR
jgi:hypothetical protein